MVSCASSDLLRDAAMVACSARASMPPRGVHGGKTKPSKKAVKGSAAAAASMCSAAVRW